MIAFLNRRAVPLRDMSGYRTVVQPDVPPFAATQARLDTLRGRGRHFAGLGAMTLILAAFMGLHIKVLGMAMDMPAKTETSIEVPTELAQALRSVPENGALLISDAKGGTTLAPSVPNIRAGSDERHGALSIGTKKARAEQRQVFASSCPTNTGIVDGAAAAANAAAQAAMEAASAAGVDNSANMRATNEAMNQRQGPGDACLTAVDQDMILHWITLPDRALTAVEQDQLQFVQAKAAYIGNRPQEAIPNLMAMTNAWHPTAHEAGMIRAMADNLHAIDATARLDMAKSMVADAGETSALLTEQKRFAHMLLLVLALSFCLLTPAAQILWRVRRLKTKLDII